MLTLRSATRKGGNFMADVGLISAGQDENKKSLSPIFKKLRKTVIIVTPILLFSSTALAAETTKCSEFWCYYLPGFKPLSLRLASLHHNHCTMELL